MQDIESFFLHLVKEKLQNLSKKKKYRDIDKIRGRVINKIKRTEDIEVNRKKKN